jgi:hypothetical protein
MQWLDSFFLLLLKIFDCNYGRFEWSWHVFLKNHITWGEKVIQYQ